MPDDDRIDDESNVNDDTSEAGSQGGRRLVALGKPPYDDPDPEAMDRFIEDMLAQMGTSAREQETAVDADGEDGTPDVPQEHP